MKSIIYLLGAAVFLILASVGNRDGFYVANGLAFAFCILSFAERYSSK